MTRRRLPVRLELAVLFAAAVFLAGLVFIVVNFGVVDRFRGDNDGSGLWSALVGIAVISAVGVPVGWIIAGQALRPLASVTAAARRVSAATLHERIALDGPDDELKDLADTIDALLNRLDASFQRERRFVANASHELRTPLTITRTTLELGLARADATTDDLHAVLAQALTATTRSESLVNELLLLARSETIDPAAMEVLDLAELSRDVVCDLAAEAARSQVTITTGLLAAPVTGVPGLVDRIVVNLVVNAIHHNVPRGDVAVRTDNDGSRSSVTVSNSCAPIELANVEPMFEPFWRGPARPPAQRRPGHGLGLSIVRAIAHGHQADIVARVADGRDRFTVTVTFPSTQWEGRPIEAIVAPGCED